MFKDFFAQLFESEDEQSFNAMLVRLPIAILFLAAAVTSFLVAPRSDVTAISGILHDQDYGYFAQTHIERAQNRYIAQIEVDELLKNLDSDNVKTYAADHKIHGNQSTSLNHPEGASNGIRTVSDKKKNEASGDQANFDPMLLPTQCQADFSYLSKACNQIWVTGNKVDRQALEQCQAFAMRQAITCEVAYCEEKLKSYKRSLFIWGIILFFVGVAVAAVFPPLGILIAASGIISFGLSVAPFFDMLNFINCR